MTDNNEPSTIHTVEITEIPRSYQDQVHDSLKRPKSTVKEISPIALKFSRFLSALMYTDTKFGYRILTSKGIACLHYITRNNPSMPEVIRTTFASQFPNFDTEYKTEQQDESFKNPVSLAMIRGIPQDSGNSLSALAEVMMRFNGCALYQVVATPSKPSRIKRMITRRRYKATLEKAQAQQTRQELMGGQQTTTQYDVDALLASKQMELQYKRLNADRVLKCQVTIAFWGDNDASVSLRTAVNALMASTSSHQRDSRFKITYLEDNIAIQVLKRTLALDRKRMTTELQPEEATPFFKIPIGLGIRIGSPAQFSHHGSLSQGASPTEPAFREGQIALGHIFHHNKPDKSRVRFLDIEHLRRHVAVLGVSGSGKTTTKNRIAIDAWKNGIPSLLIEPVKTDARILFGSIPELRLFTVGREDVAPYRLNPFSVESGVPVQLHIDLLYSCFVAAWPLYGILSNHLRKVLVQTYERNGWDTSSPNSRGRPITLELFRDEAERYSKKLRYSADLRQDFEGAILARAEDLCDPSRALIFNSSKNLSMAELLSTPTVIELKHLGDPGFNAFVLSLLMIKVYEYFDSLGPSNCLKSLLVIDEAHRLLEELPQVVDMSEGSLPRRQAIDQLVNLIAEARSSGLGIIIADQDPARLSRAALKNCQTKIVHRLTSFEDQRLIADEIGCTEEQRRHIGVLKDGEAVLRSVTDDVPAKLKIIYDPKFHASMAHRWSDEDVRERMKQFYQNHPELARKPPIPHFAQLPLTGFDSSVSNAVLIDDMVQDDSFRKLYFEVLRYSESGQQRGYSLEELIAYCAVHLDGVETTPLEISKQILELASAAYGDPPIPVDWDLVREFMVTFESGVSDSTRFLGGSDFGL